MARKIGAVYLGYFLAVVLATVVSGLGQRGAGMILELCSYGIYAVLVLLLYRFFEPVDRGVSLAAVVAGILGCIVGVLALLHRAPNDVNQLLFFALFDLLIGVLIVKSTLVPRAFGVLMIAAGMAWLIYVAPGTSALAPYLAGLGIVAEVALMLRLLFYFDQQTGMIG